jgi:hypothetical protein
MPHAEGAYLGSIRTIADVRERCVIDADSGCWHLRTAHGRPQDPKRVQRLWIFGKGAVSATRAVWELSRERQILKGRRAVRMCDSYDCANPKHIKALTHSEAQRHIVGGWHEMTPARQANLTRLHRSRRRFTPEQITEIRSGTASAASLARKWGCSPTSVCAVRKGLSYREPVSSVWGLAA